MGRRINAAFVVAVLVCAAIVAMAPPASASSYESDSVSLVNRERSARGLRTLRVASDLVAVARKHSARMAARGDIYHNPNLRSEVRNWEEVGENVGVGRTVRRIHDAFMASSGHRANILHRSDNTIGVGVVVKGDKLYLTQIFVTRKTAVSRSVSTSTSSPAPAPERVSAPVVRKRVKPVRPQVRTVSVLLRVVELQ